MAKYLVTITMTKSHDYEVEAQSKEEAYEFAKDFVRGMSDYWDIDIEVVESFED